MIFENISHLEMSKIPKNSKSRAAQMVKMADLALQEHLKLISRKSERHKIHEIAILCNHRLTKSNQLVQK